jgi:hypothetical protein
MSGARDNLSAHPEKHQFAKMALPQRRGVDILLPVDVMVAIHHRRIRRGSSAVDLRAMMPNSTTRSALSDVYKFGGLPHDPLSFFFASKR